MKSSPKIAILGLPEAWSSQRLADAVAQRLGAGPIADPALLAADFAARRIWAGEIMLGDFDAVLVKKLGRAYSPKLLDRLDLLDLLSSRGVRIFSSPSAMRPLISRLTCTARLVAAGIPTPPTVITPSPREAAEAVRCFEKAVFKPLYTSKAAGMSLLSGEDAHLVQTLEDLAKGEDSVYYIQKLLKSPGFDFGIVFLGGKYLASYCRDSGPGTWNTTTRSGGRYTDREPSLESIEWAERAQALFGLDFTCVDVMETPEGPRVFEVSALGGFRGLEASRRINAAERYVDYVLERL